MWFCLPEKTSLMMSSACPAWNSKSLPDRAHVVFTKVTEGNKKCCHSAVMGNVILEFES